MPARRALPAHRRPRLVPFLRARARSRQLVRGVFQSALLRAPVAEIFLPLDRGPDTKAPNALPRFRRVSSSSSATCSPIPEAAILPYFFASRKPRVVSLYRPSRRSSAATGSNCRNEPRPALLQKIRGILSRLPLLSAPSRAGFSAVTSSALVGLVATFVPMPARLNEKAFKPRCTRALLRECARTEILSGHPHIFIISLIGGMVFVAAKPHFNGIGGKMGAMAFVSSLLFMLVRVRHDLRLESSPSRSWALM